MSLLAFAATSAMCGLTWDLESMIIFRILQAIPGGVLPVVVLSMVFQLVPPKEIGTAMGIYGFGVVFAPAVGPTLGGYLIQYLDWRWIFFVNVPICLLGATANTVAATASNSGVEEGKPRRRVSLITRRSDEAALDKSQAVQQSRHPAIDSSPPAFGE